MPGGVARGPVSCMRILAMVFIMAVYGLVFGLLVILSISIDVNDDTLKCTFAFAWITAPIFAFYIIYGAWTIFNKESYMEQGGGQSLQQYNTQNVKVSSGRSGGGDAEVDMADLFGMMSGEK